KSVAEAPPITDPLFLEYYQYLRVLATYALENHEALSELEVGLQLTRSLQEGVEFHRAQALRALEDWPRAKAAFRQFLGNYPHSTRRTQVQLELASIEWSLENKYEALQLYREIYTRDISSGAVTAGEELRRLEAFESLTLDAHLDRAERLRRAALFEQG